jgi:cytochrome c-type biogenesis protein CcmH/NrfG
MIAGLSIFVVAILRMQSGFATDRAFPVPVYMVMHVALPHDSYVQAAAVLQHADPSDGEATIAAAEADAHASVPAWRLIPRIKFGLQKSPTSARGWTLLAEQYLAMGRRQSAVEAISTALLLSPFDYWIAGRRARVAAMLFGDLDHDTRSSALRQAELLWDTPSLRTQIPMLLRTPGGGDLISQALGDDPRDLRALNRWLAADRRRQQGLTP